MSIYKVFWLMIVCLCALSGCSSTQINSGYQYDEVKIGNIIKARSSEGDVLSILGTPTAVSDYGDKTFYYIGAKYSKITFFNQKLLEQKVVAISFNNKNVVNDIVFYDTEDAKNIEFSTDKITIEGNEVSLVKQFKRNLGRFSKSSSKF